MAAPPPTILALKRELIEEQVRLLSQPLAPSHAWRTGNNASAQAADRAAAAIPQRAVEAALVRVNHRLHQHVNRVYSSAATRHVSEQLEQLYLMGREESRQVEGNDQLQAEGITSRSDFADDQTIAALPTTWPLAEDRENQAVQAKRFSELTEILRELSQERQLLATRVSRLRSMHDSLASFRTTRDGHEAEAASHIQRNLVTKDGELERELERTRILMARVGDGVARLMQENPRANGPASGPGEATALSSGEEEAKRRVADLLDRL